MGHISSGWHATGEKLSFREIIHVKRDEEEGVIDESEEVVAEEPWMRFLGSVSDGIFV